MADAVIEKEYVTFDASRNRPPLIYYHRKGKLINQALPFSWSDAIDAVADVYNGVC